MSPGNSSPAAISCSIGVNRMKFSRLINVTSMSARRASVLSKYIAALSPAKPPPAMIILVLFNPYLRAQIALSRNSSAISVLVVCGFHFILPSATEGLIQGDHSQKLVAFRPCQIQFRREKLLLSFQDFVIIGFA